MAKPFTTMKDRYKKTFDWVASKLERRKLNVLNIGVGKFKPSNQVFQPFELLAALKGHGAEPALHILDMEDEPLQALKNTDHKELGLTDEDVGGIHVVKGALQALPFKKNKMDLIVCTNVLMHLNTQQVHEALEQLSKTLKKGGYLVISAGDMQRHSLSPNMLLEHGLEHENYIIENHEVEEPHGLFHVPEAAWVLRKTTSQQREVPKNHVFRSIRSRVPYLSGWRGK